MLEFSAIESKHLTENGHGWRNEVKKKKELRTSMYSTHEKISCSLILKMDNGLKTIITQYNAGGTGIVLLLVVSDYDGSSLLNGKYNDGIFDVYVRYIDVNNRSNTVPITTIKSNEIIEYSMENNRGNIKISIDQKTVELNTKDSESVYLKFGDYLQAQYPKTKMYLKHKDYEEFYENVVNNKVIFQNFKYTKF